VAYTVPTVADFKAQFPRDFPYAVTASGGDNTDLSRVTDTDIAGAITDAGFNVNEGLFATQAGYTRAYLFLAAHCLVQVLLAAGEGVKSSFNWLVTSKSAGDLSESFAIPRDILEDPYLGSISKTRYGSRYLEIISPLLVGNFQTFFRQTPP
jgi:hypothetical protein